MRIMVFDVPAESGGALSVLHDFYSEYKKDHENEYIFVVSLPELKETNNTKILRFPWIKKSWFHRLYFDHFIAPKLIRKYKVDKVLSLQNIIIPHTKVYQSVFVHNALPFSDYRFGIFENTLLWVYQNIIGKKIIKSIRLADHVIVQTNWMRKKCLEYIDGNKTKVEIKPPKIDIEVKEKFSGRKRNIVTFFYPASAITFKNHKIIFEACMNLKEENVFSYKVVFTLAGNENKMIKQLYDEVRKYNLPIEFIGQLSREQVFAYYSESVLLFPSYIESFGLPLLEAKHHGCSIIVSSCNYSQEILGDYPEAIFFSPHDSVELSSCIKKFLSIDNL